MKRGQPKWTVQVPSHELQAINDWIDSDAKYQASDIHNHLNLVRYCCKRTFRDYVRQRRVENLDRAPFEEGSLPPSSFSLGSLEEMSRAVIGKTLLIGEMPAYALPSLLASLARMKVAEVSEEENRRREELHQAKMEKAAEKLVEVATAEKLTPDQVAEIRSKVLGL